MKTKHILFSIALGATFAACSSDDNFGIAVDNSTDAKLAIRPLVDAEITFGGITADTRFALGEGARPVWSTNDQLGACIIDVPTYTDAATYATALKAANGKAIALYNVTNYYGCNNAFVTSDGGQTWKAEHPMVEGNYLFYAPYQEGMGLRSPLEVCVPLTQDASAEKKALEDFYSGKNIVRVGYQFLAGINGTQKPSVKMHDIFAYPKFKITNNFDGYLFDAATSGATSADTYKGTMTIDKIEFYKVNKSSNRAAVTDVVVGGVLSHTDQATAPATSAASGVIAKLHEKANGFTEDGVWNVPAEMLGAKTADLLNSTKGKVTTAANQKAGRAAGMITTLNVGQTVETGKSLELYCVMPAMGFNFDTESLMAKVYVTIDGKEYVIYDGKLNANAATLSANAEAGYLFDAKGNAGLSTLTLVNGQKLPAEAIRIDADGKLVAKTGVNDLLEIKLEGGLKASTAKNVQIAVRKDNNDGKVSTNEGLIEMIQNAPNGTNWDEKTTTGTKKFTIADDNTIVINSELIDALADNNGNEGGKFAISTVVPIANDVKVTEADASASTITLESANKKTYTIKLNDAIVDNGVSTGTSKKKYVIIENATAPTAYNENSVVIVNKSDASISLASAAVKVKSLHVIKGKKLALVSTNNPFTASNIRNEGTIEVDGTISAKVGEANAELMNNGVVTVKNANAKFTVTAGEGDVTMAEGTTTVNVAIATGVNQKVIYVTTDALATTQITTAADIPSINTIEATGNATIDKTDLTKLKGIKRIQLNDTKSLTTDASCDFKGITVELLGAATWKSSSATTVISNATIELGTYNLQLTTISVNGTKTGSGKVLADGTTSFWNGGESK